MLENQIESYCQSQGVLQVGFADIRHLQLSYPTAISFAIPMLSGVMNEVTEGPTHTYFSLYRTVNRLIDDVALQLSLLLEANGHVAMLVPASQSVPKNGTGYQATFSHRQSAFLAGLGTIGKNNALIHPTHGPRVRLGTILTTFVPGQYGAPSDVGCLCGGCKICVDACPAKALTGTAFKIGIEREAIVDVRACSQHMHKAYQHIGRGAVCGICLAVCPKGSV